MASQFYTQVPSNPGHDHFANANIDSFPDLHAHHTFEDKAAFIHHSLVSQLATNKPENVKKCTQWLYAQTSIWGNALNSKREPKSNFAWGKKCLGPALLRLLHNSATEKCDGEWIKAKSYENLFLSQ